jgi:hypothetical protein
VGEDRQANWLAHLPAHLLDFAESQLAGGRQSGAGTVAARQCEAHARCVCADCHAGQAAGGTEGDGDAAGGKGNEGEILIGPSAISEEAVSD